MEVIRDEELGGIMMIPLFHQWNVHRCNVRDCKEKPTTILTGIMEHPIGLCEHHYTESKALGKFHYTLDFNDYKTTQPQTA